MKKLLLTTVWVLFALITITSCSNDDIVKKQASEDDGFKVETKVYVDFEVVSSVELEVHTSYENHAKDVTVNSNQGEKCIIVEITNNSKVILDEIEYIVVLYKGEQIVTVEYPKDVMDVPTGQTITEKVDTYDDYDRFEVYLNQAHTFGL